MRFAMTARTIAKLRAEGKAINDMTAGNIAKVTRFREGGEEKLEEMVGRFERLRAAGDEGENKVKKEKVYNPLEESR